MKINMKDKIIKKFMNLKMKIIHSKAKNNKLNHKQNN